jgi:hypothetical protein
VDLTFEELGKRLAAECKARKWRPPSRARLKKLRDTGQLPKAILFYEKGQRGRSARFPEGTVDAYIRAEKLRRASGKRVRSWKLAARRESASVIRAWLSHPEEPIPREVLAQELEGLASALRLFAPVLYACIERPIGPREDDRVEEAHTAIEQVLDASGLRAESRPAAEAILQLLIFRDEDGKAEDFDLSELLEPIRQRAGPFARLGGIPGLRGMVNEIPINALLTHPTRVLNGVPDPELRDAARMTKALFDAVERVANVAKRVMEVAEKARRNERLRGDVRIEWLKSIVDGTTAVAKFLQSDLAPTFVAMGALANVFLIRNNPNTLADSNMMMASITGFASLVEQSQIPKLKNASLNP